MCILCQGHTFSEEKEEEKEEEEEEGEEEGKEEGTGEAAAEATRTVVSLSPVHRRGRWGLMKFSIFPKDK